MVDSDHSNMQCSICLSDQPINSVKLPCNHIFCFLCIKGHQQSDYGDSCPMCRAFISADVINNMKLSDVIDVTESDCEYQWMYRGVRGGWWKYDTSSNSELEDLYNEWMISQHSDYDSDLDSYASDDPVPEILIGATHFEIDFNRMRQINRDTVFLLKMGKYNTLSMSLPSLVVCKTCF